MIKGLIAKVSSSVVESNACNARFVAGVSATLVQIARTTAGVGGATAAPLTMPAIATTKEAPEAFSVTPVPRRRANTSDMGTMVARGEYLVINRPL